MEAKASGGIQNHASEVSMDFWKAWDVVLNNDRTLDDLEKAVHGLMAGIEAKR
jgi:dephospho-CoA kinase